MSKIERNRFGGKGGYSIIRAERFDSDGNLKSVVYEVVGPEGDFFDSFSDLDRAMRLLNSLVGEPEEDDASFY